MSTETSNLGLYVRVVSYRPVILVPTTKNLGYIETLFRFVVQDCGVRDGRGSTDD